MMLLLCSPLSLSDQQLTSSGGFHYDDDDDDEDHAPVYEEEESNFNGSGKQIVLKLVESEMFQKVLKALLRSTF